MALSHDDSDQSVFIEQLLERADRMREQKCSEIAGGKEGEEILAAWRAHGVQCIIRPDDPQAILRISVGGGSKTPVPLDYCTVRGNVDECIDLLERAIKALWEGPQDDG